MKRVLFVIPSLRVGGAERQLVDLVNGLVGKYEIHLITFESDLTLKDKLIEEKISFYNYPRKYKYDIIPIWKIANVIRDYKIDIIHCTMQFALFYGYLGRMISGIKLPIICSIHTTINRSLKNELFERLLYVKIMKNCNAIIAVCNNQNQYWSNKYPFLEGKIKTIHNGIDHEHFYDNYSINDKKRLRETLNINYQDIIIGMVAGFRIEKGHEYAFAAIKKLKQSDCNIKLMLLGNGKRRIYLEKLADKLSIAENIIWVGEEINPKKYLSIVDIYLSSSFMVETFSIAILEALSMGRPIVATNVGGTSEMVVDGNNGYIVPPKDPVSLADKLMILIKDHEIRNNMSNNARKIVNENYTSSKMVDKTKLLLDSMLCDK